MKSRLATLVWILAAPLGAAEVRVIGTGLNVPVFDEDGTLVRRLTAASAEGIDSPVLRTGHVDFYSRTSPTEKAATMDFDNATYHHSKKLVTSDDRIRLDSPEGFAAGKGFEYHIRRNFLVLKTDVTGQIRGVKIAASRGEFRMAPGKTDPKQLIEEGRLTGGVVLIPAPGSKFDFERAECESAHYRADTQQLIPSSPVTYWQKDKNGKLEKVVVGGEISIDLSETSAPVAP